MTMIETIGRNVFTLTTEGGRKIDVCISPATLVHNEPGMMFVKAAKGLKWGIGRAFRGETLAQLFEKADAAYRAPMVKRALRDLSAHLAELAAL